MLIVGPNSTCDVCMENYMDRVGIPHAITCGHIFCRACLDSVRQCPLCRNEFSPSDICKLCVDGDAQSSTTVAASPVGTQVQRLLDDIAMTTATVEEMERVIQQCNTYHNAQPNSILHTPLGVSYLLLSTLVEAQRKLLAQGDQLSELAGARDDIRDRLTFELEATRLQCRNSEQARRDERERALRNEEVLRAHCDEMNALWRSEVESTRRKCLSLLEGVEQVCQRIETAMHCIGSFVVERSDTAILRLTFAAVDSLDVREKLDKVELLASRLCVLLLTFPG
ncbi:hypothetical protein HD554DRAFT_1312232 [Boletus coccyginus]|nr:hypothetical protein HD554DRAFT_1312232 [Boletus coccyginus]